MKIQGNLKQREVLKDSGLPIMLAVPAAKVNWAGASIRVLR